ncbi:MAG: hypothetical protein QOJ42_6873, partial [Acidobacteriaceae bacterium]|nr:hypothetical protein [Acidobacteriaceae bacterium]
FLYDTLDALRSKHFPAPSAHLPLPAPKPHKISLLSASGNVRNLDLRHVTILYTTHPTAASNGNTRVCRPEKLPGASADPAATPPRITHRLPRAAGRRLSALSAHIFPTFLDPSAPIPPAHLRRTGQPAARRVSRGIRPISSRNPGTFTSFPIYRQDAETADRICCNLRRLGQVADKPVSGNLPSHWSETESTGRPSVRDADYSSKWNSPMVISEHYGVFGD